mgnify:CR=1 FL=1
MVLDEPKRTIHFGSDVGTTYIDVGDKTKRVLRSAKHRYIYVIGNKKDKRQLKNAINYKVKNYPKYNIPICTNI